MRAAVTPRDDPNQHVATVGLDEQRTARVAIARVLYTAAQVADGAECRTREASPQV